MPADLLRGLAWADPADTDLVLCEGSMGLFDGVPAGPGQGGSSADLAALTGWPVVLVHDCSGQSQSAAALLMGCAAYDPRIRIAGVILNRLASERHRRLVSDAVAATGLTIFGAVPRSEKLALPERHLGLVQAGETGDLEARVDAAADVVAEHVDLDALLAAAAVPGLSGRNAASDHVAASASARPPARPADRGRARCRFLVPLPARARGLAARRGRGRVVFAARRRAAARRLRCLLAPGRVSRTPCGADRACRDLHGWPPGLCTTPAGARRMRGLHGAGPQPRRRGRRRACHGRASRRRDEFRATQAAPRLPTCQLSWPMGRSARPARC